MAGMNAAVPPRTLLPCGRRAPAEGWLARLLLLMAVVAGLVGMHSLGSPSLAAASPGHTTAIHSAQAAAAAHHGVHTQGHTQAAEQPVGHSDCPKDDHADHGGPCPNGHGHPGAMCQSGAPTAPGALSVPALIATISSTLSERLVVSPTTAAAEAAAGSGCGPPSLSALSISRT